MARQEQVIKIRIETSQAKTAVTGVNNQLKETSATATKAGKGLKGVFATIKTAILSVVPALAAFKGALISTGVGAIVVALGSFIKLMIKAGKKGAEFGKSLSGLKAVSGATADEMNVLSQQAKDLGSSTAFTASQVVKLQTELAKLGFTTADIANSTPAILDLAASLEVSLAEAAEFAGSVVRSFGLTTEETQRVVDVMALSTASSALNFSALTESLKVAAPTAKAVGISVERTTALLGALADTGLKGSIAGTGLSKTFIQLNKEGISLEEAMDKVRTSSNQLNTAVDLVGVVGAKSLLNLANAGDKIGDLEDKFNNAAGAAKNIAETRLDNLAGDTTKLGSAWEGFLLNLEDGSGVLNKLARGSIQLLTKGITYLQDAIDFTAFAFKDGWRGIKEFTGAGVQIAGGYIDVLGQKIKLFSNNALLAISEIPIIGRAIDKEQIEQNIKDAEAGLQKANKKIDEGVDRYREEQLKQDTAYARFAIQQETNAKLLAKKQQAKQLEEAEKIIDADEQKRQEEREKQREKDLEKLNKIQNKFKKKAEDLDDVTELQKAERQRERALAEIEQLKLTEAEKRNAVNEVNAYYDELATEAKAVDDENAEAARIKKIEDAKADAEAERQLELQKRAEKQKTLDNAIAIAGAESGIGRALLVAKQVLLAKNLILDAKEQIAKAKKTVTNATLNAAEGGTEVAKGASKAASAAPPPFNVPFILAFAAQAVGIISSIKSATSQAKSVASSAGGGGGGGGASITAPRVSGGGGTPQAPAFNVVGAGGANQLAEAIGGQSQQPIKAYVTSQDVTSAQSLDRNIVQGATIGG